jgi:hypothetical protein
MARFKVTYQDGTNEVIEANLHVDGEEWTEFLGPELDAAGNPASKALIRMATITRIDLVAGT